MQYFLGEAYEIRSEPDGNNRMSDVIYKRLRRI